MLTLVLVVYNHNPGTSCGLFDPPDEGSIYGAADSVTRIVGREPLCHDVN